MPAVMAAKRRRIDNRVNVVFLEHRREIAAQVTTEAIFLLWRAHAELDRCTVAQILRDQFRHSFAIVDDDYPGHLRLLAPLCATSVFSVSLWFFFHHRDTENTEIAQRRSSKIRKLLSLTVCWDAGVPAPENLFLP